MANALNQDADETQVFSTETEKISKEFFQWKPVDVTKVKLSQEVSEKYTITNNTLVNQVKDNPADDIEVEIGDVMQPDFYPQIKMKRWNNEVNFSARLVNSEESPQLVTEAENIKWKGDKVEAHFYQIPPDAVNEDGAFELEAVFKEKPLSNVVEFTIQTKELDFFYQPPLTQEEIDEGSVRPDNVVGSYAVYHKSKRNNLVGGMEYKTGKSFHIYRPKAVDMDGNEVWCELNIDEGNGLLTVTVPQEFLDSAAYPVKVDPTFGYTSVGSSGSSMSSSTIVGTAATLSEDGDVSMISIRLNSGWTDGEEVKGGLFNATGSYLSKETNAISTGLSNAAWNDFSFAVSQSLVAAGYVIAAWASGAVSVSSDTGSSGHVTDSTGQTYPTWPSSVSLTSSSIKSIYATYTAGGGSASPSASPSSSPSVSPSASPSASGSASPSISPSSSPSSSPSPSASPSRSPSASGSASPSISPSSSPSSSPSPSSSTSASPSVSPSQSQSASSSISPSASPSPSASDSNSPSSSPSSSPSEVSSESASPSQSPSSSESASPSISPSASPSPSSSISNSPSRSPSDSASNSPSSSPSSSPSPSASPSVSPSDSESASPSSSPSKSPSASASQSPSSSPSPSSSISNSPSLSISNSPSISPSASPSAAFESNSPFYFRINDRLSIRMPVSRINSWNTSGRPTGRVGAIGINTETGKMEVYDGSTWQTITFD